MATKAERARASSERTKHRTARKLRERGPEKPARKAKRKRAARSKSDTGFNLTEQKGSPEQRFRQARARATHTRGKTR